MVDPSYDTVPTAASPDEIISKVIQSVDANIAEMDAFCQETLAKLTTKLDALLEGCGGTLEQCRDAVRQRIDTQVQYLIGDSTTCRDAISAQLHLRMDEYFLQLGLQYPGITDSPATIVENSVETWQQQQRQLIANSPFEWMKAGACAPSESEALAGYAYLGIDPSQLHRYTDVNSGYYAGTFNGESVLMICFPVGDTINGGQPQPGPITIPGGANGSSPPQGVCYDADTVRQACERAGGRWTGSECLFSPSMPGNNGTVNTGDNSACPGGSLVVRDLAGNICTLTCSSTNTVDGKVIYDLAPPALLWCNPCPPGNFTVRDRRTNVVGNSCKATCVASESSPGNAVLELETGSELYCGPCGKPSDNPVGIEQPEAYRFQQRQQPWFRDMVNWAGQHVVDYVNSQTSQEYFDQQNREIDSLLTGR